MKYDPFKSFGYPVLRPFRPGIDNPSDTDYVKSTFEPSFSAERDTKNPGQIIVHYDFSGMKVAGLLNAIKEMTATYAVRIVCKKTFFSKLCLVGPEGSITLEGDQLDDIIELNGYILSLDNCVVEADQINREFGYQRFSAAKDSVLAWAPPTSYFIGKEFYKKLSSIFTYVVEEKLNIGEFYFSLEGEHIGVYANSVQIESFKMAQKSEKWKLVLLHSIYVPVIAHCIYLLRNEETKEEYQDYRWAHILLAKMESFNFNDGEDHFKVAQKLFHRPFKDLNPFFSEE